MCNSHTFSHYFSLGTNGLPSSFGGNSRRDDRDRDRGGFGGRSGGGRPGGGFGGGGGGRGGGRGSQPGASLRKPKWDLTRLSKFEKNFYVEHPKVTNRSPVLFLKIFL